MANVPGHKTGQLQHQQASLLLWPFYGLEKTMKKTYHPFEFILVIDTVTFFLLSIPLNGTLRNKVGPKLSFHIARLWLCWTLCWTPLLLQGIIYYPLIRTLPWSCIEHVFPPLLPIPNQTCRALLSRELRWRSFSGNEPQRRTALEHIF